jgi:hypothetical protein
LPVPKPKAPEIEVKNHNGNADSRRAAARSSRQAAPAVRSYPTWY